MTYPYSGPAGDWDWEPDWEPEHDYRCPRFYSFEMGESAETAPPCECASLAMLDDEFYADDEAPPV